MATFMDFGCTRGSGHAHSEIQRNRIVTACKLGYTSVAVNNFVEALSVKTTKKGKEKTQKIMPPDRQLLPEDKISAIKNYQGKPVRQHSRFSMVLSNVAQVSRLTKDENIQAHELLSVRPTTEKLFHMACRELEIDIISLNLEERLPFFCKRAAVGMALERGIHFEICYSPMIRDQTARKNIISNATSLISVCKGKNIIISSDAEKPMELRGPYDVANLALLFGLTEAQAKDAISTNCRAVLLHSAARKAQKGIVSVMPEVELAPKDQWKIKRKEMDSGDNHENGEEEEEEEEGEEEDTSESDSDIEDLSLVADASDKSSEPPVKRRKQEKPTDVLTLSE